MRVGSGRSAVAAAAQTLGRRALQPEGIRELLEGKFASALRTVAAQMTLEDMHERRSEYGQRVKEMAAEDLAQNGLQLENLGILVISSVYLERPRHVRCELIWAWTSHVFARAICILSGRWR